MRLTNSLPEVLQKWAYTAQNSIGALGSGFAGLLNSSDQHHQASQNLLNGMSNDLLGGQTPRQDDSVGVTVNISAEYHRRIEGIEGIDDIVEYQSSSMESNIASLNEAGVTYSASAKLIKASSAMIDALFDAIA
jgi:hypothetical protein